MAEPASEVVTGRDSRLVAARRRSRTYSTAGLLVVLLTLCAVFTVIAPNFATVNNLLNVGRASSIFGIAALGITIPMIAGATDVSFGAIISVGGIVTATLLGSGASTPMAIGGGLLAGVLLGGVNGLIATRLHIDALIVTLGTLSIYGGAAFLYTNAQRTYAPGDDFAFLGRGYVAGVPVPICIGLGIALVLALVLRYTTFGQRCFVVGDNPRAASLSGIRVGSTRTIALAISGVTAATAGILVAANNGLAFAGTGETNLLSSLAAVVIGGTALAGGSGTILGTLLGIALLGVIDNGLNLMNVQGAWQDVVRGGILVLALVLDRLRYRGAM